jgi:hypothetical protein
METKDQKNDVSDDEIKKITQVYFDKYETEFKKLDYKSKVIKTKYLIDEHAKFINHLIDNTTKEK